MATQQTNERTRVADDSLRCSPIVDLRQYTLYPGTRDRFVELFDKEFVETQEAAGMRVIGQFRDLGDPNRFVWMRGFSDMPSRETALTSFYIDGAAWAKHGESARSMMIDSSDALLVRPARPNSGFALGRPANRPPVGAVAPRSVVVATIHHFDAPVGDEFLDFYDGRVTPVLRAAGAQLLGSFVTEHSSNNFPRLPLREGENVFVAFHQFGDLDCYHDHLTALGQSHTWRYEVRPSLSSRTLMPPQILRLAPTSRSQLGASEGIHR